MRLGTEAGKAEAAAAGPRGVAAALLCRGQCLLPGHDVMVRLMMKEGNIAMSC